MFKLLIVFALCMSMGIALYLESPEPFYNSNGDEFYLYRNNHLHRQRRQISIGTGSDGSHVQRTQELINDKNRKVDLTSFTSTNPQNQMTVGQQLDYLDKRTDSAFKLAGQHTQNYGTDLQAAGQYNFLRTNDGRGTIGLAGEYSRHFGGPWGTQQPNYGVFIRGNYNFP
ncbi:PREDICTED: uncharacterized protein LOC108559235 [Nicrophorus vespilloides]|uniref:Uncharacterized protein LOC108559235 n=1 Tax=Nicrophorus vespilloides TaxID=110193 RepID=A0ABM1MBI5_NICVS|nr:PREDICTED: uncharacterized protein LOC108559235 [Nicrophorus vespilloides]